MHGRLKYSPNLISPCHSVGDDPKSSNQRKENLKFIYLLLLQFLKDPQEETVKKTQSLFWGLLNYTNENLDDTTSFLSLIERFKDVTKQLLQKDPQKTFEAKLILRRDYKKIDEAYYLQFN